MTTVIKKDAILDLIDSTEQTVSRKGRKGNVDLAKRLKYSKVHENSVPKNCFCMYL